MDQRTQADKAYEYKLEQQRKTQLGKVVSSYINKAVSTKTKLLGAVSTAAIFSAGAYN